MAETRKLDGNSSYGKTVTNKERHTDVIYCQEHQVSRYLVDPSFRRCNQLSAKTFEVEMSKKTIHLDLPMHIGCFVYQYAKLRMLEFYFDFTDVFVDRRNFQWTQIVLCSLPVWRKMKDVDRVLPDIVPNSKKTLPYQLTHQNVDSAMHSSECNPCCI